MPFGKAGDDLSETSNQKQELPAQYPYVADDVLAVCKPRPGVWLDVGAGPGGLGLALAACSPESVIILLDPSKDALEKALAAADEQGFRARVVTVIGSAEDMPLPDACVDLVVSRGSVFFWQDRPQGIREAHRVLRPGGKAMIGGGLGRAYPARARREFIRRRRDGARKHGGDALRSFQEVRSRDTFQRWAKEAGLADFEVVGEPALPEDASDAPLGMWLRFQKKE